VRSASVVSVVSDAATRCAWCWAVAAAARLRVAEVPAVPFATDDRFARVVFAASPRTDAASADAARDAAVRFDGGDDDVCGASSPAAVDAGAGLRVDVFEAAGFA
jgi:hypothetical protein